MLRHLIQAHAAFQKPPASIDGLRASFPCDRLPLYAVLGGLHVFGPEPCVFAGGLGEDALLLVHHVVSDSTRKPDIPLRPRGVRVNHHVSALQVRLSDGPPLLFSDRPRSG